MDNFDLKGFINENNLGAYSKLPSSSNLNEITPAQQKYADKAASRPSKPKKTQFRKDIEGAKRMIDSGKSHQEVIKRFGIDAYNAVGAENEYLEERKIEVNEPSQLKDLKNQIENYYGRKLEPSQINTMVGKDDKIANLLSKYKKLSKEVSETTKGNIVSEDLEEASGLEFKVGDKVKYLGHPGVITKAETDIMDRPHYSVSYNKGTGDTKATNIYNKGGEIKKAISETKDAIKINEASGIGFLLLSAAMLQLTAVLSRTGVFGNTTLGDVMDSIKDANDRRIVRQIARKLKDDQEIKDFLKLPPSEQKGKWRKLIATKLQPNEMKLLNIIYKKHFEQNESRSETTKGNIVSEEVHGQSTLHKLAKSSDSYQEFKQKAQTHLNSISKNTLNLPSKLTLSTVASLKNIWNERNDDEYDTVNEISETKTDYDFSEQELIRVLRQLKTGASTEVDMIRAFKKALGRELTDDEIRGHKVDPSRVGKASMEEKKVEVDDETEFKITLSHLLDKHVK